MATPFKRICLRASHLPLSPFRSITTTAPLRADSLSPSDPDLDQLSRQPGVKYTLTTEPDRDLAKYNPSDLSSLAHRELDQHRELREMVRLAAWEMPLLAPLSRPFERPQKEHVLRWRYTTYMGEAHPAARKVVVTFNPHHLPDMEDKHVQKLLKLAGPRYDPAKRQVKMSCESFETAAQNKRYLADTIGRLVAEAKDPNADTFEDVPLDLRHHRPKTRHEFPREWVMTKERRMLLQGARRAARLEEAKRVEGNALVDGTKAIEAAKGKEGKEEQAVMVEARRPASQAGRR